MFRNAPYYTKAPSLVTQPAGNKQDKLEKKTIVNTTPMAEPPLWTETVQAGTEVIQRTAPTTLNLFGP